jgi:hypothetical protein
VDELRPQLITIILRRPALIIGRRTSRTLFSMRYTLIFAALLLAGCRTRELPGAGSQAARADAIKADSPSRARQDSINRATPGYVVESLLPPAEEARRFRAAFPGYSATAFAGGAPSRDALVRRFLRALAAADTNGLRTAVVTPREFVDLYYPGSPYASRPYHQSVGFAWQMIRNPSDAGFRKLMQRLAGHPITFVSQRCEPAVQQEGSVDRYTGCLVRIVDARGDTVTRRLFGSIVSYRGDYKFLSFTNDM